MERNFIAVTWLQPTNLCKLHSDVFIESEFKETPMKMFRETSEAAGKR